MVPVVSVYGPRGQCLFRHYNIIQIIYNAMNADSARTRPHEHRHGRFHDLSVSPDRNTPLVHSDFHSSNEKISRTN